MRVVKLERMPGKKALRVALEHLHKDQEGHVRSMLLALPIRPNGRTGAFFSSCSCNVEVGAAIPAGDVIGETIKVKFGASPDGGREVVTFKPCKKEERT